MFAAIQLFARNVRFMETLGFINSIFNFLMANPLGTFILAVLFGFLGLLFSVMFWDKLNLDKKIRNWPSVPGKITSSRIEERLSARRNGASGRSKRYMPVVKYSFTVTGTVYHGERIGNGIYVGITRGAPERVMKRFPAGATVPVYYDPAAPSEAVLEKTMPFNAIRLCFGIVYCIVGVFFAGIWLFSLVAGH